MAGPLTNRPAVGLRRIRYAVLTADTESGVPTYGTIYSLPDAVKLSFKSASALTGLFADDGLAFVGESVGEMALTLETADLTPDHEARLLGHQYVDGAVVAAVNDASPWVAIGGEILLDGVDGTGSAVYGYVWYYKAKFSKPDAEDQTKEGSIKFRTKSMEGRVARLLSSTYAGQYRIKTRTDDPAAPTTFLTNFFSAVAFASADLSALTVTALEGTAGDAKKIIFTFAKGSGLSFTVDDGTVSVQSLACFVNGARKAGTFTAATTGTTSVIKFTPSSAFSAADKVTVVAEPTVKDKKGVACTPYSTLITIA